MKKHTIKERKMRAEEILFMDVLCPASEFVHLMKEIRSSVKAADRIRQEFQKIRIPETFRRRLSMSYDEFTATVTNHVNLWRAAIGEPRLKNLVHLCEIWRCPFRCVYNEPIEPQLIADVLGFYLIGQEEYCQQLGLSIHQYFDRRKLTPKELQNSMRNTMMVFGSTGTGKTYGIQTICSLLELPLLTIYCNTLSQDSGLLANLSEALSEAYSQYNQSKRFVSSVVICFDNFLTPWTDKALLEKSSSELLSILGEHGEIPIYDKSSSGETKKVSIPTDKMLFVFTNTMSIDRMNPHQKKRHRVGFVTESGEDVQEDTQEITTETLEDIGLLPEFTGRIRRITFTNQLSEEELVKALNSEFCSPLLDINRRLSQRGINLTITHEGKRAIAAATYRQGLGARGMESVLNKILDRNLSQIMTTNSKNKKELIINEESVSHVFGHFLK